MKVRLLSSMNLSIVTVGRAIDFDILRFIIRQSAVLVFDLDAFALRGRQSRLDAASPLPYDNHEHVRRLLPWHRKFE